MRKFGHAVGLMVVVGLLASVGVLTYKAIAKDRADKDFNDKVEEADKLAHRAVQLAAQGIPAEGAVMLLRRDPENQGHELFKQNCASCHSHGDAIRNDRATAADLAGFGTREWIVGLLTNPHDPRYLARTKLKAMTGWLEREHAAAKKKGKR